MAARRKRRAPRGGGTEPGGQVRAAGRLGAALR